MGNQQYVQHDWSNLTYVLLEVGMVVFVVIVMGLFLVMVQRAGQATGPARPSVEQQPPRLEPTAASEALPQPPGDQLPAA